MVVPHRNLRVLAGFTAEGFTSVASWVLKISFHDAPHKSQVDAKVGVRQPVSHPSNLLPGSVGPLRSGRLPGSRAAARHFPPALACRASRSRSTRLRRRSYQIVKTGLESIRLRPVGATARQPSHLLNGSPENVACPTGWPSRSSPRRGERRLAERVGFEPTCPFGQDAFEAPPLRPLRYLSVYCFARWGPFSFPISLRARGRLRRLPSGARLRPQALTLTPRSVPLEISAKSALSP